MSWCDLDLMFDLAVVTLAYIAGSWYLVGTLVGGYMCATSWCNLDLTFDLAYLILFYLSMGISDTILSLSYLSYLFTWILVVVLSLYGDIWHYFISLLSLISFYLNLGCWPLGVFWCRLSTVKVILEFIDHFTFPASHCKRWYCIKWATGFAPTPHKSMYGHICMYG